MVIAIFSTRPTTQDVKRQGPQRRRLPAFFGPPPLVEGRIFTNMSMNLDRFLAPQNKGHSVSFVAFDLAINCNFSSWIPAFKHSNASCAQGAKPCMYKGESHPPKQPHFSCTQATGPCTYKDINQATEPSNASCAQGAKPCMYKGESHPPKLPHFSCLQSTGSCTYKTYRSGFFFRSVGLRKHGSPAPVQQKIFIQMKARKKLSARANWPYRQRPPQELNEPRLSAGFGVSGAINLGVLS